MHPRDLRHPQGAQQGVDIAGFDGAADALLAQRGVVAPGYWVVGVAMDPFAVTVRGDEQVLSTLDRIETLPIEIGDLSATRTLSVKLSLPTGVTLLKPTDVSVTVTVQPLTGTRVFSTAIVVTAGSIPTASQSVDS